MTGTLLQMASNVTSDLVVPAQLEDLARDYFKFVEFVEAFPEDLNPECPICLQILKEPQLLSCCGYSFCLKCITSIKTHRCPLCQEEEFSMLPDKRMERLINQRKVHCPYKKHGCNWSGERCKLLDHLCIDAGHAWDASANACLYFPENCKFCALPVSRINLQEHKDTCDARPTLCRFCHTQVAWNELSTHYQECPSGLELCDSCADYVSKADIASHKLECDFRPTPCKFCGTVVGWKYLVTHYQECPSGLGLCPNAACSKPMRVRDITLHLKECPYSICTCHYLYFGCQENIYRKDMQSHLENNAQRHLEMLDSSHKQIIKNQSQLSEKLQLIEAKSARQQREIARLNAALSQARQAVLPAGEGSINFLLVSDLAEDALDEDKLRSRFGQFGTVTFVYVLPDSFASAAVVYDSPKAYKNAIKASKTSGIKLCREFVQVHPIYSVDPQDPYDFDDDDDDDDDDYYN